MQAQVYVLFFVVFFHTGYGQQILGPDKDCITCICYAASNCYNLTECALKSISQDYWDIAGQPNPNHLEDDDNVIYNSCIRNDQCITGTIRDYITPLKSDCNKDGKIDCLDYAAIHFGGIGCENYVFNPHQKRRLTRCISRVEGAKPSRHFSSTERHILIEEDDYEDDNEHKHDEILTEERRLRLKPKQ